MTTSIQSVVLGAVLTAGIVASAVGCVYAKHESRKLFTELQTLIAARDRLEVDWGRLQIEQSTWSTHARVEQMARKEMKMKAPAPDQVLLVGVAPAGGKSE